MDKTKENEEGNFDRLRDFGNAGEGRRSPFLVALACQLYSRLVVQLTMVQTVIQWLK